MISGGASGIGLATARAAADDGAQVTVFDIVDPELSEVKYYKGSVAVADDWRCLAANVEGPDHLFLKAGVMSAASGSAASDYAFTTLDETSYRRLIGVNVDGVVLGLQGMLSGMPRGSCVVVTASLAGLYAYDYDPLYAMTKHAVAQKRHHWSSTESLAALLTWMSSLHV